MQISNHRKSRFIGKVLSPLFKKMSYKGIFLLVDNTLAFVFKIDPHLLIRERMELFKFDLADMAWSSQPFMAELSIRSEPFGKGGFREAFKATSKTPTFQVQQWVVTKYLKSAIDVIKETK